MSAPAVSVVIPSFRRAATIRAAAESVLRQSWTDLELIVVDDGSRDGTDAALAAIEDPRLSLITHEVNRGGNAARNTGARAARAEWIAFQDSDDEWLPEKLERQMLALATLPGAIAAFCGMMVVDRPAGGGRAAVAYRPGAAEPAFSGDLSDAILDGNLISTQTLVARREALEAAGGFDEALPALQDWDMAIRLAPLGPIAFVDEPLVVQRLSSDSLTKAPAKRLAAYAAILAKAEARMGRPRAARHALRLALGHARLGERGPALDWARRAAAGGARDARLWLRLARVLGTGGGA